MEGCAALGKLLEPQECVARILPVIVNFSEVNRVFAFHSFICIGSCKFAVLMFFLMTYGLFCESRINLGGCGTWLLISCMNFVRQWVLIPQGM